MIEQHIRLSRISYPRANMWAVILLITVFMSFGVLAQVCFPEIGSTHADTAPVAMETYRQPSTTSPNH